MTNELVVVLEGREAGRVGRRGDRLSFAYADAWRADRNAYALSLSMPLAAQSHPHERINNFIWGLLPDNDRTLERWGRQFRISARNPFALIAAVGEECAGAVQFLTPERFARIAEPRGDDVVYLDEVEIGERLRSVLTDAGSGRTTGDNGQFSLAGAQPKTALLKHGLRWGIPSGRIPTTHILKPPAENLPGHAENEHFCLTLARKLGLRTVASDVLFFDGQPAICVERYDRFVLNERTEQPDVRRLHQEDMCQALGVHPDAKYQNEGGPSATQVLDLIRNSVGGPLRAGMPLDRGVAEDMWTFVDALIFNWLIGGTDGHAKNYAFLLGPQQLVRLAPLYDIASAYGYDDIAPQRMKLAMKVARHYHIEDIVLRHWRDWAKEAGLAPEAVAERMGGMAASLPLRLEETANRLTAEGLWHPIIDKLTERLTARAKRVAAM